MTLQGCTKYEESRVLWGFRWNYCQAFTHKALAIAQRNRIARKGKITRIQTVKHLGGKAYLVWWRTG
jgi:hypothetical protein